MDERLNADFRDRVVLDTGALPWVPSPLPGVERRMLDRIGGEVARATSLVRYAPGSRFSAHEHPLGEEFLVLEGTFSDEHGDFPAGSYVRNPPGSRHAPRSEGGCTIFVKLRQFAPDDLTPVAVDTTAAAFSPGEHDGVLVLALHEHGRERVRLMRLQPGAEVPGHGRPGGEEVLVLDGAFDDGLQRHAAGTWVRYPPGSGHAIASDTGALLWVKSGHLPPDAAG